MEWKEYELGKLLPYEQPTAYIVESTDYSDVYNIPVLTAGKSFILGYTNETTGIFNQLPVIIFDDFTTATQYVNFKFKVKSSAMKILHINTDLVLPKYIYYRMQIIQFDHSTHKRYWIQQYSKIKIAVPSLTEQECIVARIEELFSKLDKAVETLRTTKQQLAVYRQAVAKDAYEGKFTYGFENRCEYFPLVKLGKLARGKSKHRPRNDPLLFENGTYPFVQTGEIKAAGKFITKSEKFYNEVGLAQSQLWPVGTLCITIAANIAETAFLGVPACFPDSVVGFMPSEKVLPEYVRYFIESQKLRLWAYAPATAQKNINLKTLENLHIPYCSLPEQKKIVAAIESRLSVCDSIEQTVDAALQQADALRQSILKEAFERRL